MADQDRNTDDVQQEPQENTLGELTYRMLHHSSQPWIQLIAWLLHEGRTPQEIKELAALAMPEDIGTVISIGIGAAAEYLQQHPRLISKYGSKKPDVNGL